MLAIENKGGDITQSHAEDNRNYLPHSKQGRDAAKQSMFSLSFATGGSKQKYRRRSYRLLSSTSIS